jgi:integrase
VADGWLESLERKPTTRDGYRSTIAYAKEAFGNVIVRRLGPGHLAELHERLKAGTLSASTRAKHLRVVHACLAAAVEHNYAGRVPKLPKAQRPRPERKEAAYFTDDELPRLFAEITSGGYRVMFETALKTGMREGELLALTWADVDPGGRGHPRPAHVHGRPPRDAEEP